MGSGCFKLLLFILFFIKAYCVSRLSGQVEEDNWMDPDAWTRDHLTSMPLHDTSIKCCKCLEDIQHERSHTTEPLLQEKQPTAEDMASIIYFKKFITILFNRKNYKYDSTQRMYERSIVFSINSDQMEKLEQLQDPRDLDNVLVEILNNIRTPNMHRDGQLYTTETTNCFTEVVLNVLNLFHDALLLTKTSEIRFVLIVAATALIAWFLNTRYHIGWLPMFFGGMFIYGYFHTYLECNRELEVNQMLEILNLNQESVTPLKGSKLFNFFRDLFSSQDAESLQKQNIIRSSKVSLGFCRPDHVLIIYFNDIFMKYLQALVEQCSVTLRTLNSGLGFPYNLFSGFLLICMIGYTLKMTFKYIISPSAWAHFIHRKQLYQSEQPTIKNTITSQEDRISGDNLKLLLNAINIAPQRLVGAPKLSNTNTVSGVEEVKEALKPPPEDNSSQVNQRSSSEIESVDEIEDTSKENPFTNMENVSEKS